MQRLYMVYSTDFRAYAIRPYVLPYHEIGVVIQYACRGEHAGSPHCVFSFGQKFFCLRQVIRDAKKCTTREGFNYSITLPFTITASIFCKALRSCKGFLDSKRKFAPEPTAISIDAFSCQYFRGFSIIARKIC
jgi:hypothetical protein